MIEFLVLTMLQTAAGEPAAAQPPTPAAVQAQAASPAATEEPERLVCRMEVHTGSRFGVRRCRTQREIEANRQRDQDSLNSAIRQGTSIANPN